MPIRFSGGFLNSVQSWKQRTHFCKDAQILAVFSFLREGTNLGTDFSQPFLNMLGLKPLGTARVLNSTAGYNLDLTKLKLLEH